MAQLKDLLVSGPSRLIGKLFANEVQLTTLNIPTASNGSTYGAGTSGQVLTTNGTSTYWGSLSSTQIPPLDADQIATGVLPVARGGTGLSSITSGQVMIGNGTGNVTTRAILNNTSAGALGWNSAGNTNADNLRLIDVNTLAYWNGAYSGTSSNLKVLGTVTTGTWNATTIGTAYGGTGNMSFTANRLIYTESTTKLSSAASLYATTSSIGINTTTAPSENLYVNGNANFNIGTNDNTSHKRFKITGNSRYLSLGASGFQAYNSDDTVAKLYIQYNGGAIDVGQSSTASTITGTLYGTYDFKTANGFNYSGIGAESDNTERYVWFSYNGAPGRPVYDADFKYNPAANQLHIAHANGKSGEFRVTYSGIVDMWMGVGSGNENHGLYDAVNNKWMISSDVSGNVTVNGNSATATKLSNTPNTTTTYLRGDNSWQTLITSGTSTLAWNNEITLATVGGVAIKAKLPANPNTNTDTLVKQTASTTDANYKILTTTSASPTSGNAAEAAYDASITINPSTHNLSAGSYNNGIKVERVTAWSKRGPYDAGWKRVCALTGYHGYGVGTVYINGSWSSEEPTLAILEISFSTTNYAHIKQIIGARKTTPDQVRLVYSGTGGKWYFDIHIPARTASSATGVRYVTFVGALAVSEKDETTNLLTSEPTTTTVTRELIVTNDQPTITVNLASTTAGAFTGANMTTGISGTLPIANGGTGATTAANARTNLGLGSMAVETATNYLKWQTTTAASTALYDFGVYVNMNNAAGTGMTGGNYFNIINIPYRKASGNTKADWGFQIGNTTSNDNRLWYRTSGDNVWGDWQTIAHATQSTSATGSSTKPVYMTSSGVITACDYSLSATVNSGTETYMAYYSGANAISATSNARIVDGALQLWPSSGTYREGLRIYPTGSWSTIVLGGNDLTAASGTSANSWSIHNNNGGFYISKNGSSSATIRLQNASNQWEFVGSTLKITNNSNTVNIGSQNTSFTHIYNTANIPFIFNNTVLTTTGDLGNTSYPFNNLYIGKSGAKGIYYVGTKATKQMITFVDNTSDANGNGIKIGGGGVTVVGAGESAANYSASAGDETLYLLADGGINIEAGGDTIANRTGLQITSAGHLLPVKAEAATNLTQNIGSITQRWKEIHANALRLSGPSSDPSSSAGARIEFSYDASTNTGGSQPVYISYTPNDAYRAPAGLKVFGGASATPAWFETEGSYYATGTSTGQSYYINSSNVQYGRLYIDTKGVATTTTTYTNPNDSSQTKTGYIGGVVGKAILILGNNKTAGSNGSSYSSPGSAGTADNAQGYLRVYGSGTTYGELSGYGNYIYPTNGIAFPENKVALNFRPSSSSYYSHFSHQTSGNEALVMATQNAVTSFIFVNGESLSNIASDRWTKLTGASGAGNAPGLQIKNNCVSIGKLIPSGTTPTYKLEVNGTGYFADDVTTNKAIYFGNNTGTAGGCILGFSSSYPKYGIWYFDDSIDVMTFSASGNADSKTGADLAINVHGAGTVAIRNNRVPHTGNTTGTVGSTTQPVYVDAGQIKAITGNIANSTTGNAATATKLSTDGASGQYWAMLNSSAQGWKTTTVSNTWTAGTTAGPTIKTTVNGVTGTAVAIPSAASNASGIITTGAQTIAGAKTLTGTLTIKGLKATSGTDYGETLPSTGAEGQVFFQLSNEQYELPTGGTSGQALVKTGNGDRQVGWADVNAKLTPSSAKFYVSGSQVATQNIQDSIFNTNVYVENDVLQGAAWNDYAEYRETTEVIESGRVVIENGDDTLSLSTKRMQPGAEIVSDTFGFAIGQTEIAQTPIATTGRVLAYPDKDRATFKIGQPVCSGPNGTVSQMTNEEAAQYPWLIIGTVSAIPQYTEWNNVKVNNRIWIRVR